METATLAGVFGAILGSFLNVVAYRLPRHESLIAPASRCARCGTPVKPYDNIPIVSFLLLRGHCRSCKAAISPRYPLVEALTAGLCAGAAIAHTSAGAIALSIALILLVVPVALIDIEHRIIPNSMTGLGALAGEIVVARKGAREGGKTAVPFGPFLALGAVAATFVGNEIVHAYVHHFL